MDEAAYQSFIKRRELHGLVLAMSTDTYQAVRLHDLWLRCIIVFFAGVAAVGAALAWRNIAKSSDLQLRLVRTSELNTHLKQMNLAAAGLVSPKNSGTTETAGGGPSGAGPRGPYSAVS